MLQSAFFKQIEWNKGKKVNLYEHFFWNYALFFRKTWAWKVGVGGLFPDLVYMVAFIPRLFFYRSFMEWMHDPLWDALWNSFMARSVHSLVVWGACLALVRIIFNRTTFSHILPFLIGWGLHILFDAFTHASDGYALFYPLSGFRFISPVSYWETAFHAREYFLISHTLMAVLILLWIGWKLKRFLKRSPKTSSGP